MRYHVLCLMMFLFAQSVASEELPRKIKPVMVWTGTDSKHAKESFARCCSRKDWQAAWHKHIGEDDKGLRQLCPEVDFDSFMVIAIFHGESYQNRGIGLVTVSEEKECL